MAQGQSPEPEPNARLDQISTEWSLVRDSGQFVRRYTPAISKYLHALIRNRHDVEDVLQDFLLRVLAHGFVRVNREGGRFRDYLKTAVRNAARNHLQRKPGARPRPQPSAAESFAPAADGEWLAHWRQALLDRAWLALQRHQLRHPGNLAHTVLRLAVEHAGEPSHVLAARAGASDGQRLRPDAFRKQLSRARRLFAQLLVKEVAQTLDRATPEQVEDELCELGLMEYVHGLLPPDWRRRVALRPAPGSVP